MHLASGWHGKCKLLLNNIRIIFSSFFPPTEFFSDANYCKTYVNWYVSYCFSTIFVPRVAFVAATIQQVDVIWRVLKNKWMKSKHKLDLNCYELPRAELASGEDKVWDWNCENNGLIRMQSKLWHVFFVSFSDVFFRKRTMVYLYVTVQL